MKFLKLILAGILMIIFSLTAQAQKKKTYYNVDDTPEQISAYAAEHFSDHKIIYTKKKSKAHKTKYKTRLDHHIKLEFDENFQIKEIDSKDGLPSSVIPQKIADYAREHYPNHKIIEWERKKDGRQEIELDNKLELIFDQEGNFLKID